MFSTSRISGKTDMCLSTAVTRELLVSFWGLGAYLGPPTFVLVNLNCKWDVFTCFWLISKVAWSKFAIKYRCDIYHAIIPDYHIHPKMSILVPVGQISIFCPPKLRFGSFKVIKRCSDPIWIYFTSIIYQLWSSVPVRHPVRQIGVSVPQRLVSL